MMKTILLNIKMGTALILGLNTAPFYSFAADYNVNLGENTQIATQDLKLTVSNMTEKSTSNTSWGSAIAIMNQSFMPTNCDNSAYLGTVVVDGRRGYRIADGIILVIEGTITGTQKANASANDRSTKAFSIQLNWLSNSSNYTAAYDWSGWGGVCAFYLPQGTTTVRAFISNSVYSDIAAKYYIYASASAVPGTYQIPGLFWGKHADGQQTARFTTSGQTINVIRPRTCTVSTDNTITFPPVDVSDAKNNQVLANKTGNLTINCNDATNAPVTVEMQGTKGRYTDAMALTMKDGSDAPAEVRGFIGKDIPLTGQCNGRLDGYPGIVYFIPNGGLEKMKLTPGANKYNWVLCSKGQNKTGQATGSAKLILNWD